MVVESLTVIPSGLKRDGTQHRNATPVRPQLSFLSTLNGTLVAFPREARLAKPKANYWWPKSKYPTSQMCFPTRLGHI